MRMCPPFGSCRARLHCHRHALRLSDYRAGSSATLTLDLFFGMAGAPLHCGRALDIDADTLKSLAGKSRIDSKPPAILARFLGHDGPTIQDPELEPVLVGVGEESLDECVPDPLAYRTLRHGAAESVIQVAASTWPISMCSTGPSAS